MEIYVLRGVSKDGWKFIFSDTIGHYPTEEDIEKFCKNNDISKKSVIIFVSTGG